MIRSWLVALPLALVAHAAEAQSVAAPPPPASAPSGVGFTMAARASVAIPFGDAYTNAQTGAPVSLGDDISVAIPLQLDLGVRIASQFFVGAYVQYGWGIIKSEVCPAGVSCSETGVRVGLEFLYSFAPQGSTPWVGIGTGWEWTTVDVGAQGLSGKVTLDGWEFFNLQVGYDFAFPSVAKLGPFIALSVGQYSWASISSSYGSASGSIADQTVHGWVQFGLKGTLDL